MLIEAAVFVFTGVLNVQMAYLIGKYIVKLELDKPIYNFPPKDIKNTEEDIQVYEEARKKYSEEHQETWNRYREAEADWWRKISIIMFFIGILQTLIAIPFGSIGNAIGAVGLITTVSSLGMSGYLETIEARFFATLCALCTLIIFATRNKMYEAVTGGSSGDGIDYE